MNKIKKLQFKYMVSLTLVIAMAVFAIGVGVYATAPNVYQRFIDFERFRDAVEESEEEAFGGSTMPTKWISQNGLVTYIEHGSMIDASTTLVSFLNPFGVPTSTDTAFIDRADPKQLNKNTTSTIDYFALHITTTGTTTSQITCGASSDGYTTPTYHLFHLKIGTTTIGVYENNVSTTTGGHAVIGGGNIAKIQLTRDYPHFVCHATGTAENLAAWSELNYKKGITGSNNTFDGTWTARVTQPAGY